MGRLFLLFTVVPLVELYLLIAIGRVLGPVATIALVLVTGALGAWFARLEGARVLRRWQEALARQELPKDGLVDGLLIFVGGLMLITPGILTDIAGLSMVLPPTRRIIGAFVRRWFQAQVARGTVQVYGRGFGGPGAPPGEIIDVEGEVIEVVDISETSDAPAQLEK